MAIQLLSKDHLEVIEKWAEVGVGANILPANVNKYQIICIIQTGYELGLEPMQSLRSMSFINGRLVMSTELKLAIARKLGVIVTGIKEEDGICEVTLKRGDTSITSSFTRDDARKAELGKYRKDGVVKKRFDEKTKAWVDTPDGVWEKWEKQMLRWRAINNGLKLIAPDVLMRLPSDTDTDNDNEEGKYYHFTTPPVEPQSVKSVESEPSKTDENANKSKAISTDFSDIPNKRLATYLRAIANNPGFEGKQIRGAVEVVSKSVSGKDLASIIDDKDGRIVVDSLQTYIKGKNFAKILAYGEQPNTSA